MARRLGSASYGHALADPVHRLRYRESARACKPATHSHTVHPARHRPAQATLDALPHP